MNFVLRFFQSIGRLFRWGYTGGFQRAAFFTGGLFILLCIPDPELGRKVVAYVVWAFFNAFGPYIPTIALALGAGFLFWQGMKNILGMGGKKKK